MRKKSLSNNIDLALFSSTMFVEISELWDVTTLFITETYHIYLWTNNSVFLKDMWPHVVKAITWMIDGGTKGTGLPYRLQCTYDQLFLNLYDHNTFNSFLYVLGLRAAEELCKIMDDLDFNSTENCKLSNIRRIMERRGWILPRLVG